MELELLNDRERNFLRNLQNECDIEDAVRFDEIAEIMLPIGWKYSECEAMIRGLIEKNYLIGASKSRAYDTLADDDLITQTADHVLYHKVLTNLNNGNSRDAVKYLDSMMYDERKYTIETLPCRQLRILCKARYYDE